MPGTQQGRSVCYDYYIHSWIYPGMKGRQVTLPAEDMRGLIPGWGFLALQIPRHAICSEFNHWAHLLVLLAVVFLHPLQCIDITVSLTYWLLRQQISGSSELWWPTPWRWNHHGATCFISLSHCAGSRYLLVPNTINHDLTEGNFSLRQQVVL